MASHRIDQLAPQQVQRRSVVKQYIMKRVRDDLGEPHQARLHVFEEKQMHRTEGQTSEAHDKPDLADMAHESEMSGLSGEEAE